jgi:hypothetical protein
MWMKPVILMTKFENVPVYGDAPAMHMVQKKLAQMSLPKVGVGTREHALLTPLPILVPSVSALHVF